MRGQPTLVAFSHLRWSFVYQRPQHLLSRLAARYRVLFFEEPVYDEAPAHLERIPACAGVEVLRPHTPVRAHGYAGDQLPVLERLLAERLAEIGERPECAWLYTPMALPLLEVTQSRKGVVDCMDELSQFRNAPPDIAQREAALLARADVVFCGGASLYRARKSRHSNIHCFPSSVDAAHFAPRPGLDDPHPGIPRPRLGYCGVIDERIDLPLLGEIARRRPDWQIVLVGPTAKIDPADVPDASNVHCYGQQPYAELPKFMAAWDVALMPFALNEATRYISPTKTLEYLAAERPVVSTPVPDVVAGYTGTVEIADTTEGFMEACERVLAEPADGRAARLARARACVSATSWDRTAGDMQRLIDAIAPAAADSKVSLLPARATTVADSKASTRETAQRRSARR